MYQVIMEEGNIAIDAIVPVIVGIHEDVHVCGGAVAQRHALQYD
jgi:hypothetical protein